MAYTYTFRAVSSGTLLPDGTVVSGSSNVNYTFSSFLTGVSTSINKFQVPSNGNTFSGVNPSYLPISGTGPIQLSDTNYYQSKIRDYNYYFNLPNLSTYPTLITTISGLTKVVDIALVVISGFKGGYRLENPALSRGYQTCGSGFYINMDNLNVDDYISQLGSYVIDPQPNSNDVFPINLNVYRRLTTSGFEPVVSFPFTHSGTGMEWYTLNSPFKISTSNYNIGVGLTKTSYGVGRPFTGKSSFISQNNSVFTEIPDYYYAVGARWSPKYSFGTFNDPLYFSNRFFLVDSGRSTYLGSLRPTTSPSGLYIHSEHIIKDQPGSVSGTLALRELEQLPSQYSTTNLFDGNIRPHDAIGGNTLVDSVLINRIPAPSGITSSIPFARGGFVSSSVPNYIDLVHIPWLNTYSGSTISGSVSIFLNNISNLINKVVSNSFGLMQSGPLDPAFSSILMASFHKEVTTLIHSIITAETDGYILRCSSGFMGRNWKCWGCDFEYSHCDVRSTLNIMLSAGRYNVPTFIRHHKAFMEVRSLSEYIQFGKYIFNGFAQPLLDLDRPVIKDINPEPGKNFIDRRLSQAAITGQLGFNYYDEVTALSGNNTRIWIKRNYQGYNDVQWVDNFSFYSQDFKQAASGLNWVASKPNLASSFKVNNNFSTNFSLGNNITSMSYLDPCLGIFNRPYMEPRSLDLNYLACIQEGTNYLEITPSGGGVNANIPRLLLPIPSGNNNWILETKLRVNRVNLGCSCGAGLTVTASLDPEAYGFWVNFVSDVDSYGSTYKMTYASGVTISGTTISGATVSGTTISGTTYSGVIYSKSAIGTIADSENTFLRLERVNNKLYCKQSANTLSWTQVASFDLPASASGLVYVGPCAYNSCSGTNKISAYFDYVSLQMSGVKPYFDNSPEWELLVFGTQLMNSNRNSGYTSNASTGSKSASFRYTLLSGIPFDENETVYIRAEIHDNPSLKLDYSFGPSTRLLITASLSEDIPYDQSRLPSVVIDNSIYNHIVKSATNSPPIKSKAAKLTREIYFQEDYFLNSNIPEVFQGSGSLDFMSSTDQYLEISNNFYPYLANLNILQNDWTIHCWVYQTGNSTTDLFRFFSPFNSVTPSLDIRITTTGTSWVLTVYYLDEGSNQVIINFGNRLGSLNTWNHIAVTKEEKTIYAFLNGKRWLSNHIMDLNILSNVSKVLIGDGNFNGYLDLACVEEGARWVDNFLIGSRIDVIYGFKIINELDFKVYLDIIPDYNSPKLIPVYPMSGAVDFCPTGTVVFDILDDYSGIKWSSLSIQINGKTLILNGLDLSPSVKEGILRWETRGGPDSEWNSFGPCPEITPSGNILPTYAGNHDDLTIFIRPFRESVCLDTAVSGINRLLYPPKTIYDISGAWGYRFYYTFDPSVLPYDQNIVVRAWGQDLYGSKFIYDNITPNFFDDQYSFKTITNTNIVGEDFFIDCGESLTVDLDTTLTFTVHDTNYPVTDIVTASSYLIRDDMYTQEVCSGVYWLETISGNNRYQAVYRPRDYFRWFRDRQQVFTFVVSNSNQDCHVERRFSFTLLPGYGAYWDHKEKYKGVFSEITYNPFPYDKTIPIFIFARSQTFLPSEVKETCVFKTGSVKTRDFSVTLDPHIVTRRFYVHLHAHSYRLEYNEWVDCRIEAEDVSGNKLVYEWSFKTEDGY